MGKAADGKRKEKAFLLLIDDVLCTLASSTKSANNNVVCSHYPF